MTESAWQADGRRVAQMFVSLADTLTADYDPVQLMDDLVESAVEMFAVPAAGILLADQRGGVRLVASSCQDTRVVELFQLQSGQGPCLDAIASAEPVQEGDLARDPPRWPAWSPVAISVGYASVYATPMRLRDQTIGALNLFGDRVEALSAADLALVRALADMATIGVLHERVFRESHVVTEQLQSALTSRVIIEQAKGVLAGRRGLSMEHAYRALRTFSQTRNTRLTEVARGIVDGAIRTSDLLAIEAEHTSTGP